MSEATFGERLAEARRIKGEAIEEVSEQLRIRPSIILAMETSNFSHMPHKGYARNMVSSYARYLGLDSTRLTEQFLREFRRWEGSGKPGSGKQKSVGSFAHTTVRRVGGSEDFPSDDDQKGLPREVVTAASRNRDRSSVWGKEDKRDTDRKFREQLRQAHDDKGLKKDDSVRRPAQRSQSQRTTGQRGAPPSASKQLRTNDYVGRPPRQSIFSGVSSRLISRPTLMFIGFVVIFVAILILWAALASNCARNDTTNVPVTGVVGTDSGLEEESGLDIPESLAENSQYGAFELTVDVVDGDAWVVIEVDGVTQQSTVLTAPWSGVYTVNSACTVTTPRTEAVKVFRAGVEVPFTTGEDGGVVELQVKQLPIVQNAQDANANAQ